MSSFHTIRQEALRSGKARKQESLPPDAYKPSQATAPIKIIQVEKVPAKQGDLEEYPVSMKPKQVSENIAVFIKSSCKSFISS